MAKVFVSFPNLGGDAVPIDSLTHLAFSETGMFDLSLNLSVTCLRIVSACLRMSPLLSGARAYYTQEGALEKSNSNSA